MPWESFWGGEGGEGPPLESTVYGGRVRIGYRKICRISYRQRPIPFRNDQYGPGGDFWIFGGLCGLPEMAGGDFPTEGFGV